MATEIEDKGVPVRMKPLPWIFMLIQSRPIKPGQGKIIRWKMARNPVEDDSDGVLMEHIDEILKVLNSSKPTRRSKIPGDLIPPRLIKRVLCNRHQLDMGKSHLRAVRCQLFS